MAALQLLAKGNSTLEKHLNFASRNAKYISKTIQNQLIHIYANKVREKACDPLKVNDLPFTIIYCR